MLFKTPREILNAYKGGLAGSWCDPEDVAKLLGELKHPLFSTSAFDLYGSGKGELSLPFHCLFHYVPNFGASERQTTGDCVSHSTRNAVDVTRAVEIKNGDRESFRARGATEAIYGARGHSGQGMSCSRAARFVNEHGGILLRQKYDFADFSSYNSSIGTKWGKRGVPKDVLQEGNKHKVKTISLVNTVKAARDALANGYALSVCSDVGFSSRRDKHGIAKRSGSWNHAMTWIACDDTREIHNETLFLIQNSWGKWNSGPKRHNQPDGSFWVREKDAEKMLSQNGSWVFSDVDGFPPRQVKWTINEVF